MVLLTLHDSCYSYANMDLKLLLQDQTLLLAKRNLML